ncbi:MAG: rhodanese-like domain-containing protein [Actinomycetota bacterium]
MPKSIGRYDVVRLIDERSAQLVEVLPADDFNYEHIAGAVNLPLKELDAEAARSLDGDRPVIFYCNDFL